MNRTFHPFKQFSFFILNVLVFFFPLSLIHADSTHDILKVYHKALQYDTQGHQTNDTGYQFDYFDKFYQHEKELPSSEMGERYVVEWKSSNVPASGENIRFHFEYRTAGDASIQKKDIDVLVDQNGFYETSIDHKGEEFIQKGEIEAWKITLLQNEKVFDVERSAFWTD